MQEEIIFREDEKDYLIENESKIDQYKIILHINNNQFEDSLHTPTIQQLEEITMKYLTNEQKFTLQCNTENIEYDSDTDLQDAFDTINYNNETNIPKPLHIRVNILNHQYVESKEEYKNQYYDAQFEETLKTKMLEMIFNFKVISNKQKGWKVADTGNEKGIKCHYKIVSKSLAALRGEIELNDNEIENIFDYFLFLECGYNDNIFLWDKETKSEIKKVFHKNHQLMYTKGTAGALQKFIISPRDWCYMQTRFALNGDFGNENYDVVSSLNYSVSRKHPFYVQENKNYVRAEIKYRGFALCRNSNGKCKTKLVYVSAFDLHGNTPKFVVEYNLKNKSLCLINEFRNTWNDKLKCLEKRKMSIVNNNNNGIIKPVCDKLFRENMFKGWLNAICLPEYYECFVNNGFDDVSYLKNGVTDEILKEIGINKIGHRLKIIAEISKL